MNTKQAKEKALDLLPQIAALNPGSVTIIGTEPDRINEFSDRFGVLMPAELRDLLLICNGASVDPGGLYGIEGNDVPAIADFFEWWPNWLEDGLFCVAGDGCGNYYVLDTKELIEPQKTHPIYFIDQADIENPGYTVSSSIWHFLWFLWDDELKISRKQKTCWPFNKEFVCHYDPEIIKVEGSSLPWEK